MPKYGYLVIEGPHDVEFVCQLLRPYELHRVRLESDLDRFFHPLVPRSFPPRGDLLMRVPVTLFLQNDSHSVAIDSAVGDTRLVQTVEENAAVLGSASLTAIGVILDSDSEKTPDARYAAVRNVLRAISLPFPDSAGTVVQAPPRLGAYVLPDNEAQGALEDVLMDCAPHVYPSLLQAAEDYVNRASSDQTLTNPDLQELRKAAGRNKAVISSMASILRPGRAVQVSIQDNRWLRDTALALPRVRAVHDFLRELLEL